MSNNNELKTNDLNEVTGGAYEAQKQKFWVGMGCKYLGVLCTVTDVRLYLGYYECLIEPVHPALKDKPEFAGWHSQDDLKASGE